MIMADVFKILFLILGMLTCTVSYWLMFSALFDRTVDRAHQVLATRPWRTFFTGILAGAPLILLGFVMASNGAGPIKLLGVALLMALVTAALFGSTGLVEMVGRGLGNPQFPSHTGALVFRGGCVVSIACVLPLVGWFVVLPAVLIAGFGAALHVLRPRRATPLQVGTVQA